MPFLIGLKHVKIFRLCINYQQNPVLLVYDQIWIKKHIWEQEFNSKTTQYSIYNKSAVNQVGQNDKLEQKYIYLRQQAI